MNTTIDANGYRNQLIDSAATSGKLTTVVGYAPRRSDQMLAPIDSFNVDEHIELAAAFNVCVK